MDIPDHVMIMLLLILRLTIVILVPMIQGITSCILAEIRTKL